MTGRVFGLRWAARPQAPHAQPTGRGAAGDASLQLACARPCGHTRHARSKASRLVLLASTVCTEGNRCSEGRSGLSPHGWGVTEPGFHLGRKPGSERRDRSPRPLPHPPHPRLPRAMCRQLARPCQGGALRAAGKRRQSRIKEEADCSWKSLACGLRGGHRRLLGSKAGNLGVGEEAQQGEAGEAQASGGSQSTHCLGGPRGWVLSVRGTLTLSCTGAD